MFLTMLLAIYSFNGMAQETIRGTVLDYLSQPMQGVTVEVVGRSEHTITDIDGVFKIEVPVKVSKIRLSYPGSKPHEFYVTPDMVVKYGKNISYRRIRGLYDFYVGAALGSKFDIQQRGVNLTDIHPSYTWGFNVSLGYQLTHQIFIGGGIGERVFNVGVTADDNEKLSSNGGYFPIFAEVRWDQNLEKKITPFADLKLGYQFGAGNGDVRAHGSVFLEPTLGARFKIVNRVNICVGASYSFFSPYKFFGERHNASSLSLHLIFDFHRWEAW